MRSVDQAGKPRRLAVFDLETTGIDVDRDRIVTCFIGLLDGDGAVLDERRWLLDPSVEIPDGAQAVHGISTSMARAHGQPASSGVQQIATALQWVVDHGLPVVAHNGGYDLSLLTAETRRHGVPVVRGLVMIDTYVIDKALDRYRPGSRRLTDVAAHYGVALGDDAHDAGADAVAAGRIALALYDRFPERLSGLSAVELHRRQIRWASAQARDLTEHLRRTGRMGDDESVDGSWPLLSGPGVQPHAPHDAVLHPARVLRRGQLALPGNAGQFASRVRTAPPDGL
ncbi:exonuclease domain-containing protein [Microbacterium xylanilyticum]